MLLRKGSTACRMIRSVREVDIGQTEDPKGVQGGMDSERTLKTL
jgi:hypothetical protein